MTDKAVSALTSLTGSGTATGDLLYIVDISEPSAADRSKKITAQELQNYVKAFPATIGVGGATPAASGAGISFPATASASSDANTLDDYEEGTWAPVLSGATFTTTSDGYYIKVGQMVTVWVYVSATYSAATGAFNINNLPFPVFNNAGVRGGGGCLSVLNGVTFTNYATAEPYHNSAIVFFEDNKSNGNRSDMGSSNFAAGGFAFRLTATYRATA